MNSSMKLAAILALAVSAGLVGTGCVGQSDGTDAITEGQDEMATAPADQTAGTNNEKTGQASEKCLGGFGGCGCCFPFWAGFDGCAWGSPFWGAGPLAWGCCGCGGFGGCW